VRDPRTRNSMMPVTRSPVPPAVAVRRWRDVQHTEQLSDQLDAIFFEASGTKSFASAEARASFRERWLGRYLEQHPEWAYVAVAADGTLAGYLVGALDEGGGFDDFAAAAQDFPAHLHVNLAPAHRSRGIGAELIEAFAADAGRAGAKGMHVVTSADARNVRFYERVGFRPRASTVANDHELVLLGRRLDGPETGR
jgi:GNAT superfamily N-acetyltransferase